MTGEGHFRKRPKIIVVENGRVYRSLDEMERKNISEVKEEIMNPEKELISPFNYQPGEKNEQSQEN